MLKLEKSKNKKRLCCRLKVSTICINLQKMETLCQHSPLNKDTNIQTNKQTDDDLFPLFLCPHLLHLTPNPFPLRERFYFQRKHRKYSCNGCSGSQHI